MRLSLALLFVSAAIAAPAPAPAQCRVVTGSGCTPAVPAPVCSGRAALGQTLSIDANPSGLPAIRAIAAVGLPGATAVSIGPALGGCVGRACTWVLPPASVWVSAGVLQQLRIPNDPGLLGQTFWAQAGLWIGFLGSGTCLVTPPAVAFTIT